MKPGSQILIVDDNDDFRTMLAAALRSNGYLTSEAADGKEALANLTTTDALLQKPVPMENLLEVIQRL